MLQAESPAQSEIADAYFALLEARDLLVERETYTQDDPFYLPDQGGVTLTLEAEFAELHNVELPSDGQWALQVAKAGWASHGEYINCLNQEDSISFPYVAKVAGTYTVTATYRSGDTKNKLAWSEPDGKITAGEVVAGAGDEARETHTVTFTLEVTEIGAGTLVFTGPDTKSPQLDKLDITLTTPASCAVTVNTQGQGTASADTAEAAPGETVTLTAQAAEGWHFVRWESEDVVVENNAFTMPEKAVTVTAVFEEDATEPTDPTDPTNPTEPTDPSEPTNPTEPTDPSEPTKPTEPSEPTKPTETTKPATDPEGPAQTGETGNPALLVALLLTSAACLSVTAVELRKQKNR